MADDRSTLALAATFSAEPLSDVLRVWMAETSVADHLVLAPYNGVIESLQAPDGVLRRNRTGVNVVLVRMADWSHSAAGAAEAEWQIARLGDALADALAHGSAPTLVVRCPEPPAREQTPQTAALDACLKDTLASIPGVSVATAADVEAEYSVTTYADAHADPLGHVPYTPAYFAALGSAIVRRASAIRRRPYHVLALDCDGTLWDGTCGEMPPHALGLSAPRLALQRLARDLARSGWLVCLCSKNADADVRAVFDQRPDMPLSLSDVAAWRVNWEPTSDNLRALAGELGAGFDAFVYLAADPVEVAEVRAGCPGVLALTLPSRPSRVMHFLRHVWAFDRAGGSDEARPPAGGACRREICREGVHMPALSFDAFLAGLDLRVYVASATTDDLARVVQLTQQATQFSTTGAPCSAAELAVALAEPACDVLTVHGRDRFGDHGLTGAVVTRRTPHALHVEGWWLSRRVLGRGVEHAVLRSLGRCAAGAGVTEVTVAVAPTPQNEPARRFLSGLVAEEGPSGYSVPLDVALFAVYRPTLSDDESAVRHTLASSTEQTAASDETPADRGDAAVWMARAAGPLSTVSGIRRAVVRAKRRPRSSVGRFVAPRSETERRLAAVWSSVLHVDRVGVHDDFFALGGDVLTGTVVLARTRATFGVNLSIDDLFDASTLAEQADLVTRARRSAIEPELLRLMLTAGVDRAGGARA